MTPHDNSLVEVNMQNIFILVYSLEANRGNAARVILR